MSCAAVRATENHGFLCPLKRACFAVNRIPLISIRAFFTSKEAIEGISVPVFKAVVIEKSMTEDDLSGLLEEYEGNVAYFVLDFDKNKVYPGSAGFTKKYLSELSERFPLIVSFPWELYGIEAATSDGKWSGILMRGGEEEKVGFKSFDDLDEILDYLEIEEEF